MQPIIREVFQSTHFNPRLAEKSSAHEGDRDGSEKTEIAWRQAQKKQQERRQEENQDERFGIRQAEIATRGYESKAAQVPPEKHRRPGVERLSHRGRYYQGDRSLAEQAGASGNFGN
jgi:hypothetical protein